MKVRSGVHCLFVTFIGRQGTLGNEDKVRRSLSVCDVHMKTGNSR